MHLSLSIPKFLMSLSNICQKKIAEELFGGNMTIEKILADLQLERHHYDYQAKLQREHRQYTFPLFSQLIQEALDGY